MTLLKLFNNVLKEFPAISENLKNLIIIQGWFKERSQQAISIIQQIKNGDMIEKRRILMLQLCRVISVDNYHFSK